MEELPILSHLRSELVLYINCNCVGAMSAFIYINYTNVNLCKQKVFVMWVWIECSYLIIFYIF